MAIYKHIAIIGSGNVADFLAVRLFEKGFKIEQIISRNGITGQTLANKVGAVYSESYDLNPMVEQIFICVPDNQIEICAQSLKDTEALVCHCAGSIDLNVLKRFKNRGVLYPLQSISGNLNTLHPAIPFLIEANSATALEQIKNCIEIMEFTCTEISSEKRLQYHLAAVFVNNFTNAMVLAAHQISEKNQLDFKLLEPLLFQTFEKLKIASPFETQTGPAKRNDMITIQKHLDLLSEETALSEIYKTVSNYISIKFRH